MTDVSHRDFLAGAATAAAASGLAVGASPAEAAAGGHLFALVVPPLRIRGTSGSPLRMLALIPR